MAAYAEDLAYIHDVGFGDFAREAAPHVIGILRENGVESGRVVDLGCGSGIFAEALVEGGYDVFGIDISPAMVALARKRAPRAKFRAGSFLQVELPTGCDAVTSLGECFNYRFDKKLGIRALTTLFKRVHDALRPGGVFVFDIAGPGRVQRDGQSHFEGDDWAILVNYRKRNDDRLVRDMTTFRKVGQRYRRGTEMHEQQLFRAADLSEALTKAGFSAKRINAYGEKKLTKGHAAYVALKAK